MPPSAFDDVIDEVNRAERKFPPFHSAHEGHSIIREELDELWDHVKGNTGYSREAYEEAMQVAAMGIRYMRMVMEKTNGNPPRVGIDRQPAPRS